MRFTLLGTGSSPGVPRPNGDWGACDRDNPKNRRRRASLLVERWDGDAVTRVVVDTGPDFRQQALDAGIDRLDAVVYTHPHADHIHGIDDVRTFVLVSRRRMPVYADDVTFERLFAAFGYCFETPPTSSYPPICDRHRIEAGSRFTVAGPGGAVELLPFTQQHGDGTSLGFRIGGFCYSSDVSGLSEDALETMRGCETLVIDALQYRPHPSHFSVAQALEIIAEIKPRRAILTHMHTPLDYDTLSAELPPNVEPGYDGLLVEQDDRA